MTSKNLVNALGVGLFALCSAAYTPVATGYTFTDMGTLGGTVSVGYGINKYGHVTGYSTLAGDSVQHAFLYDGSTMLDLGTLGATDSVGWDINDSDQVAGHNFSTTNNTSHAFLYDGISMQDLGTLGGDQSYGHGINNNALVAGYSQIVGNSGAHAFRYDAGNMQDLGTLGGSNSVGFGINSHGHMTGFSSTGNIGVRAYIYDGNSMQDIGTLTGDSEGRAINDNGEVVGISYIDILNNIWHAFYYDGNNMIDLGTLGGDFSYAFGINNNAQIVGYSYGTGNNSIDAFHYDGNGMQNLCAMTDCTMHGWDSLTAAYAINENGDMTGVGIINGEYHAFLICNGVTTSNGCAAPDSDDDGIPDDIDNCPMEANPGQEDIDYDGSGDACDDVYDNDTAAVQAENVTDDLIEDITTANPPGSKGMISKLTGKRSGTLTIVVNAVSDYENDIIDFQEYLSELVFALKKLDSFDKQLNAKINNGHIVDPEASELLDASAELRQIINNLVANA